MPVGLLRPSAVLRRRWDWRGFWWIGPGALRAARLSQASQLGKFSGNHIFLRASHSNPSDSKGKSNFGVPNLLSSMRIACAPALGYLIVADYPQAATAGVVLLGITDYLDGYIARKYDLKTPLGAVLDPLADKVLVSSVFTGLAWKSVIPVWLFCMIIGRDVLLMGGWIVLRRRQLSSKGLGLGHAIDPNVPAVPVKVEYISKANTSLQLVLAAYSVLSLIDNGRILLFSLASGRLVRS
uniref:CDP-diacylglycerol--glycerol-3-phosphate 3-phosphatidyltransferase n=1 Tax=Rhodosorus marinus TaxID=101924 RepID=A0A7S2ZL52_9RHOD|mmetsp:Transcript_23677/g.93397  ORF Transcript_23677/g.93397 Transcript_23677/m.93397 type:complete len:239 (+) Transcript_23677:108-824(+)